MMRRFYLVLLAPFTSLLFVSTAFAIETTNAPATLPSAALGQIAYGLMAVLALMLVAAWLFKKINPVALGNKVPVKVVGGVSIGNRERVMVIEVADQWIVIGVTATQINTLSTMPKVTPPEEMLPITSADKLPSTQFSSWLKRTIEKRQNSDE
jgi:flagellar protein FliO/FliZ